MASKQYDTRAALEKLLAQLKERTSGIGFADRRRSPKVSYADWKATLTAFEPAPWSGVVAGNNFRH